MPSKTKKADFGCKPRPELCSLVMKCHYTDLHPSLGALCTLSYSIKIYTVYIYRHIDQRMYQKVEDRKTGALRWTAGPMTQGWGITRNSVLVVLALLMFGKGYNE